MKSKYISLTVLVLLWAGMLCADGLMMPTDENYPKDFLRNRLTQVMVDIHGLVAETYVYQEFVNEWTDSTDVVYSFPLPVDARATRFLYWYEDKVYQAVLKVREQAVNPGTGEGGVAALVNQYIGSNGIKILLKGIKPGAVQRVQLRYISRLDYYRGKCTYNHPLGTGDFVTWPLDQLEVEIHIDSNSPITEFDIPTHPDFRISQSQSRHLELKLSQPKAYINNNLKFYYKVEQAELGVDFFSVANDSCDGHFGLFIRPQAEVPPDSLLPRRILFLVSLSSRMFGYKLSQSIACISEALDDLNMNDRFNLLCYRYNASTWKNQPVAPTTANISEAKSYLSGLSTGSGSMLDEGLKLCLNQIQDDNYNNAILVFTGGYDVVDPREIESLNTHKTGIFPIGIGDQPNVARLEMLANLNYGFVTYLNEEKNLAAGMQRVFSQISQPVLKDVSIEYGQASLSQILPQTIPSTYAGSCFFTCGRYANPGISAMSIAGYSAGGPRAYDFLLDFSVQQDTVKFVETLWAKQMIDALEWEIEIYGETPELKQQLIDLSLLYNIRCRYTAYIADYDNEYDGTATVDQIRQNTVVPISFIAGNYPNPFNSMTTLRIYISTEGPGGLKLIKIYNMLGQLVAVIDISALSSGWHEVLFDVNQAFRKNLPSGIYFVQMQSHNRITSTIKINYLK